MTAHILGTGRFVPEKVLTNKDFERMVETSDEWIVTRTGIKERHVVAPGQTASDLALQASRQALDEAGLTPDDLSHIIVATCTPDTFTPACACHLERKLGISGKIAFDINAACSGFTFGLEQARAVLALHPHSKVLLVGVDILSSRTNYEDRTTCVLFGDGAGAAVLTGAPGEREVDGEVLDVILGTDGNYSELLHIKGGASGWPYKAGDTVGPENFIVMEGREVYKVAVRTMESACRAVLDGQGLTTDDVDMLITHQANQRIIEAVGKKLNIDNGRVFMNVHKYGNTSAASVPMALAEAREEGRVKKGDLVLVAAFGGGFTWGSALIRF
ncbi:beta-ketoacyl-ACP synthase III [Desulfohalovibrio reitneri]|uniref:beta-ketoacyl-ACP synthase III n=1 Tax=Desulfohalovibrio reitneri TaxID=1307759 RepID=UPI0004A74B12|nr:beta-ketoacyl-ACP synthase III [Desulfohalovibrio reitneri]